jgi:hypothetical protein
MRRLLIPFTVVAMLLAFAAPVAAAPPIKDSGSVQQASAFASSCSQQGASTTCTDVYVDAFAFEDEFRDICVQLFTYVVRSNGSSRVVSNESGCGPASTFDVAVDATSAVASGDVQLFSCGQRSCTEGDIVSVEASWSATSAPVPYAGRATFKEGPCTYRQSFTGVRADAQTSISIGASTYAGDGYMAHEEYTVSERCR